MEQANGNGSAVMKQRIHRSEDEILKLLDEQESSGFSVKEFCELCDINDVTFNSWIKKFRSKSGEEVKGFTQVQIIPSKSWTALFAEVKGISYIKKWLLTI